MPTTSMTVHARPIPLAVVHQLLDRDDSGRRPRVITDDEGGAPLRCCLRPSRPGEVLALASYAPLRRWAVETGCDPGPYDEVGPVFIHATGCDGPVGEVIPAELFATHRVLRMYDRGGSIIGGRLVEPDRSPEAAIAESFDAQPEAAVGHVRAVEFGCFLFEVRPQGDPVQR